MNKVKKLISIFTLLFIFICIVLITNGCSLNNNSNISDPLKSNESLSKLQAENKNLKTQIEELNSKLFQFEQKSGNSTNEQEYPKLEDTEYKMFYGEWEVAEVLGRHQKEPLEMEIAEELIGNSIAFYREEILIDGIQVVKDPGYHFTIIPVIPDKKYIRYMPSLKEIGITGNYFIYVYIYNVFDQTGDLFGAEFYIKDDQTLVMFYQEVYYELKRISYIEDAEIKQLHL